MDNPKPGFYRHYKGGKYFVLDTVTNTDSAEPSVLYYAFDERKFWLRPLREFAGEVHSGPRFKLVHEIDENPLASLMAHIGKEPGFLEQVFQGGKRV